MTPAYGATADEWNHLSLVSGLTSDLLPVVSNPDATISPLSKMKSLGKTPSLYNRDHHVVGIREWTQYQATLSDVERWSLDPDLGACVQTRRIRALDCDINDSKLAQDIYDEISRHHNLPKRHRRGSSKFLLAFELHGDIAKRTIRTQDGIIEFLANGQQFVAVGQHTSGTRYEWLGGLPDEIPVLSADEFEKLWKRLIECFAIESDMAQPIPAVRNSKSRLNEAIKNDPIAQSLIDKSLVISIESDGRIHFECPFSAEHTADSSESATTYFPAFTGGFKRGNFRCLHAHCQQRTRADFLHALDIDESENDFDIIPEETQGDATSEGDASRFAVEQWETFKDRKPPEWIIKSILPRASVAVIFGESGSGKTFLSIDMALAITAGDVWRGSRVIQGRVVYIAAEDANGVHQRITAYEQHYGAINAQSMGIIPGAPDFTKNDEVKEVIKALHHFGKVDVVFVDTWAQVTPGADENSGQDMGRALRHCRSIYNSTGALVVLIHHSGKDTSKGARGWSGLRAAADCEIEVTRHNNDRVASITKLKNAVDGAEFGFRLKSVAIGEDEDGDTISSCVIEHTQAAPRPERSQRNPKGPIETMIYNIISKNPGKELEKLLDDAVKRTEYDALTDGPRDRRRDKARQAVIRLREANLIRCEDNLLNITGE